MWRYVRRCCVCAAGSYSDSPDSSTARPLYVYPTCPLTRSEQNQTSSPFPPAWSWIAFTWLPCFERMKTMKVSGSAWSISTPTPLSNLQIAYPLEHNRHKVAQHVLRNLLLGFNDYGMLTAVVPFAKRSGQPAHSATVPSVTATVRPVTLRPPCRPAVPCAGCGGKSCGTLR